MAEEKTPAPTDGLTREQRARAIMDLLAEGYPHVGTYLSFEDPFTLLVAVILSAQTTDTVVNKVTPVLFEAYPTPEALAAADPADVERIIHSTGFYRNKTMLIMSTARMIVAEFGGQVPDTMDELVRLPGVARKTANIVLSNAFGKTVGIAVDTHVFRLAHRFGLSDERNPDKVERDLMAVIPEQEWYCVNYRFIDHGRSVCTAKRPACSACALSGVCPSAFHIAGWK